MPSPDLSAMEEFACYTLNHKEIPLGLLESIQFPQALLGLREWTLSLGLEEAVLLQTCNRFEFYFRAKDPAEKFAGIQRLVAQRMGRDKFQQSGKRCSLTSFDAARHLFRVASGLESLAVGEREILGQVREAYQLASESGHMGPLMKLLFEEAFSVGRKVRSQTRLSEGPPSLAHVAVEELVRRTGRNGGLTALVVGAGVNARLLLKALSKIGAIRLLIANRTLGKAATLADRYAATPVALNQLQTALNSVDVVFVATSSPHPLVTKAMVNEANSLRSRSRLVFDLSSPRNVEPDVRSVDGVALVTLEDLKLASEESAASRAAEVEKAEAIVEEELERFSQRMRGNVVENLIRGLSLALEEVRTRELQKALKATVFSDEQLKIMETMSMSMMQKIISPLAMKLRKRSEGSDEARIIKKLFLEDKADSERHET